MIAKALKFLGPLGGYLIVLHGYWTGYGIFTPKYGLPDQMHIILFSFLSLLCLFLTWRSLWSFNKLSYTLSQLFFVWVYIFLTTYLAQVKQSFDYTIAAQNFSEGWSKESFIVEIDSIDTKRFLVFSALAIMIFIVFLVLKKSSFKKKSFKFLAIQFLFWVSVTCILFSLPIPASDEMSRFIRSISSYSAKPDFPVNIPPQTFPLLHIQKPSLSPHSQTKPHVILIMIESLSAEILYKKSPSGIEITPFMNNNLEKMGWSVEKFYGNATQTSKGQFATLFSLIPAVKSKEFTRYRSRNYLSIAELARRNGYETSWLQAHTSLNYDNTDYMAIKNGFQLHDTIEPYIQKSDEALMGSWGISDTRFYPIFFQWANEKLNFSKPQFILLSTIYTHTPFYVPPKVREIFPYPKTKYECYANAIHEADKGLRTFFEQLQKNPEWKNTVVIITGDHATPLGKHGISHIQAGTFEDSFRIPLWIVWPNILTQKRLKGPYSQLDIAPTIFDIMNLSPTSVPFYGQSLLDIPTPKPIYLIQPYAGGDFSVVIYPWKVHYLLSKKQFTVFNLQKDPLETTNCIKKFKEENPEIWSELYQGIQTIFYNQLLFDHNQFVPPN